MKVQWAKAHENTRAQPWGLVWCCWHNQDLIWDEAHQWRTENKKAERSELHSRKVTPDVIWRLRMMFSHQHGVVEWLFYFCCDPAVIRASNQLISVCANLPQFRSYQRQFSRNQSFTSLFLPFLEARDVGSSWRGAVTKIFVLSWLLSLYYRAVSWISPLFDCFW